MCVQGCLDSHRCHQQNNRQKYFRIKVKKMRYYVTKEITGLAIVLRQRHFPCAGITGSVHITRFIVILSPFSGKHLYGGSISQFDLKCHLPLVSASLWGGSVLKLLPPPGCTWSGITQTERNAFFNLGWYINSGGVNPAMLSWPQS